jgi:hypothetical protein
MTRHYIHTYAYLYCIHISQNERICIYIHTYCIYIYCIYVDRYQRASTIEGLGGHPSSLTEVRPAVLAWYLQVLFTLTDLTTGFLIVNQHNRRKLMVNLALKHWDISKCVYILNTTKLKAAGSACNGKDQAARPFCEDTKVGQGSCRGIGPSRPCQIHLKVQAGMEVTQCWWEFVIYI